MSRLRTLYGLPAVDGLQPDGRRKPYVSETDESVNKINLNSLAHG
jgi:hypothetical protein